MLWFFMLLAWCVVAVLVVSVLYLARCRDTARAELRTLVACHDRLHKLVEQMLDRIEMASRRSPPSLS